MSAKNSNLYGLPRPAKKLSSDLPNSNTNAFRNALSSLISGSPGGSSQPIPALTTNQKSRDEFTNVHNRNSRKRAVEDMLGADQQRSSSSQECDNTMWRRTKRKMDEKARLYAALKRGDIEDVTEKYGVDFDRKWAENGGQSASDHSTEDDGDGSDCDMEKRIAHLKEQVEYVDQFGRTRVAPRAEVMRRERQSARQHRAAAALVENKARPAAPASVIYGDAIQHHAFNPDQEVSERMADLASKRDREPTPPEAVHYDAKQEIRTRGTGFYQFSQDDEERKTQMDDLESRRKQTQAARERDTDERDTIRQRREQALEERRAIIREKKSKAQTQNFLDNMGLETAATKIHKVKTP